MRGRSWALTVMTGVLSVGLWSTPAARGQFPQQPQPGGMPDATGHVPGEKGHQDEMQRQMAERMEIKRNDARHQQLVKDTNKLLALATDLKAEVDKTNKDTLSLDVVKKAEEIEKLAKSVKDRMKY